MILRIARLVIQRMQLGVIESIKVDPLLLIEDLAQIVGKLIALAVIASLRAALSIVLACIDLGDTLS